MAFEYAPAPESRAVIDLKSSYGLFINGEFVEGTGHAFKSVSPSTEEVLAEISEASEADVDTAVKAARRASWLSMLAGADFIKTSTGKIQPAATMPVTMIMLEAVRDFREATGRMIGVKPAGGISTAKDAIKYLVMVNEICGDDWLDPDWFRFGASTLLNEILMQRTKIRYTSEGAARYPGPDYFTLD